MSRQVAHFAAATLTPVALLAAGGMLGGGWLAAALAYLTVFSFALDMLAPRAPAALPAPAGNADTAPNAPPIPAAAAAAAAAADGLSALLAIAHFALMLLAVRAVSGAGGLGAAERVVAFFAFGLFFGQVSNSNAHELIHRANRGLFTLGKWVFISQLFGHHASAHRLVHHVHVATDRDPNSAAAGESFYRFAPRAWWGSLREGWRAEAARARPVVRIFGEYLAGAALFAALAWTVAGAAGLAAWLALAAYATLQLLLSDYVQHYGLRRRLGPDGRPEPVGDAHSWNAPHRFSALVMLNAPRHADHHAHPARRFPVLDLERGSPTLPYPLPVMGAIALWPRRWRRLMDRRLAALAGSQNGPASPAVSLSARRA